MGYQSINNLYKDQSILLFKECYALEKIHGTSSNLFWRDNKVHFFSGGEKHLNFVALFNEEELKARFEKLGHPIVILYGEAYGGSQQKQAWRYGKALKFTVFDVKIGESWLSVPNAHDVTTKMGLEFVHYEKTTTDLEVLNKLRDAPSVQAKRNGIEDQPREGIVLRPLMEVIQPNGERICAKHKRDEERETKTTRVVDTAHVNMLIEANDIAEEWVTEIRLQHVLQKLPEVKDMTRTREVLAAMLADVYREAAGEIVQSQEASIAICKRTAILLKKHLNSKIPTV